MKTLEQIKNDVAVKHGYASWRNLDTVSHAVRDLNAFYKYEDEVATEYAAQCCDEQIKACASNVQCYEHATTYQDISETHNVVKP